MFAKLSLVFLATASVVLAIPPQHPTVLAVRLEEDLLPGHLIKSTALHNPHTRHILKLTSLLHGSEQVVYGRDTDDIPRAEIYKILTHAGLTPRSYHHQLTHQVHPVHQQIPTSHHFDAVFEDPSYYFPAEALQHL